MTYKLDVTLEHKSFEEPLKKEFYYTGETFDDIINQIDTLPFHRDNLKKHKKTAFKDVNGVKHKWNLKLMDKLN